MKPEELTIEFAKDIYAKAKMSPDYGFYGCHTSCGCLVGAMITAATEKRLDLDLDLVLEEEYGLDSHSHLMIEAGFDSGMKIWLEAPKHLKNEDPFFIAAYKIGEELATNGLKGV